MANTQDDDIGYSPADIEYQPPIGNNRDFRRARGPRLPETYADADVLQDNLNTLFSELREFRNDLENDLQVKGVPISVLDTRLQEANQLAWPASLGEPKEYISYRYYKYVQLQNTTAANVIKTKFKEAARDLGGTPALDLLTLVDSMDNEGSLIREISKTYVKKLTDAAEHRTVEFFQDWAQSAIFHTRNLRSLFQAGVSSKLPEDEVGALSSSEARNSQAIFKVKLNTLNAELETEQSYLNKNFTQFATEFYSNFLAPALQFRLNVSRKTFPGQGILSQEVTAATNSLDTNLQMLQGDQLKRNQIFDNQLSKINTLLTQQETLKNYIGQLSVQGQSLPASGLVDVQDSEEEVEFFENSEAETPVEDTTSIASPHNLLLGREDDTAHPQYYLKSGDTLSGDLLLDDGVKVDGLVPHTHAHTGEDGSVKIAGAHIEGGTLQTALIDRDERPPTPTALQLISQTIRLVPPGIANIDIQISWDGDETLYAYETQIVALDQSSTI